MYDHGNESFDRVLKIYIIKNKYEIKANFETMKNQQSNSILEQIHWVISNLVHHFDLKINYFG